MLSDVELRRNIEQMKWFTEEARQAGHLDRDPFLQHSCFAAFANAHAHEGVKVMNPASTPLLGAYMRYCVSEFVKSYPSVGILITAVRRSRSTKRSTSAT